MKTVILAGGLGSRLSEETNKIPKPMIEIGGKPLLWHIMKIYSHYNFNDFIICAGYKQHVIKEYFYNYFLYNADVSIEYDYESSINKFYFINMPKEKWNVKVINTGLETLTARRLLLIKEYLNKGEDFAVTYGDGVSDINIKSLYDFHKSHNKIGTVTAVKRTDRFGTMLIEDNNNVLKFYEKQDSLTIANINGGFFIFKYDIFDYITTENKMLEEILPLLANNNQLKAYQHDGFWQCCDTLQEKGVLENYWNTTKTWKVWND